jgi:predicted transglutaminase-like cysteine proteinase
MKYSSILAPACALAIALFSSLGSAHASGALAPGARAALPSSSMISMRGQAEAPNAAFLFCRQNAAQCRVRGGTVATDRATGAVRLDAAIFRTMASINDRVNRSIRPAADLAAFGRLDHWAVRAQVGDCEDFALEKRRQLISAGFPSSAVLVATGRASNGEMHAVLVVRTDRGDFVLDNLRSDISPWRSAGVRFDRMQSPANPAQWVRV